MTETISRDDLKKRLDEDDDFELVNVLPAEDFREAHIPGSINIPVASDEFADEVQARIPDKDADIVVYCASPQCQASAKAAEQLVSLGYTNVTRYEGGMKEWQQAGNETASVPDEGGEEEESEE